MLPILRAHVIPFPTAFLRDFISQYQGIVHAEQIPCMYIHNKSRSILVLARLLAVQLGL